MYFTERTVDDRGGGLFGARYRLPPSLARRVTGKRIAIVDDAISAGSSVRATDAALHEHGAIPVVIGALLVTGDAANVWLAERGLVLQACARMPLELWTPETCPLCAYGAALEQPG
jgi:orotate phosphoribosyltransferase